MSPILNQFMRFGEFLDIYYLCFPQGQPNKTPKSYSNICPEVALHDSHEKRGKVHFKKSKESEPEKPQMKILIYGADIEPSKAYDKKQGQKDA
ncbi:MAG: hypothetical protein Q8P55_00040 [bacterium]|nr:hypothetical protein [bacterium]